MKISWALIVASLLLLPPHAPLAAKKASVTQQTFLVMVRIQNLAPNSCSHVDLRVDLCYNIRHFERHGRALEDPWSCRQSAIHQKYYLSDNTSAWLVISPPIQYTRKVVETRTISTAHPMAHHVQYLSIGIGCWREYLNYLTEQMSTVVSFFIQWGFIRCKGTKNLINAQTEQGRRDGNAFCWVQDRIFINGSN